jgi:hypothetical protein
MAITSTKTNRWHFSADHEKRILPDPRIPIVHHIKWQPPQYGALPVKGYTDWSSPEPDVFNYAFFAGQPIECPFVENQIWYYEPYHQGWFSVYYVKDEMKLAWARWFIQQPFIAHWAVFKQSQLRKTRPLLMEKKRKTKDYDMGLNERLHEMDFYSLLLNKVEEGAKFSVIQRIGEA